MEESKMANKKIAEVAAETVVEATEVAETIIIAKEFANLNHALVVGNVEEGEEARCQIDPTWLATAKALLTGALNNKPKAKAAADAEVFLRNKDSKAIIAYRVKVVLLDSHVIITLNYHFGDKNGKAYDMLDAFIKHIYRYANAELANTNSLVALLQAGNIIFPLTYGVDDKGYHKWMHTTAAAYALAKAKKAARQDTGKVSEDSNNDLD